MTDSETLQFLFGTGLVLILLELIIGIEMGFDLVLIGSILVASSFLGMTVGSLTLALGMAIGLSFLYVVFGRQFVRKKLHVIPTKSNVDALIGRVAVVIEPIDAHAPGKIKLNDEVWRATADEALTVKTKVIVTAISGVTLAVTKHIVKN